MSSDREASQYLSTGALARELGICRQYVVDLERAGVIPEAARTSPGSYRIWPATQLAEIRERVAAKRSPLQPASLSTV